MQVCGQTFATPRTGVRSATSRRLSGKNTTDASRRRPFQRKLVTPMKYRRKLILTKTAAALMCGTILTLGCGRNSESLPETFAVEGRLTDSADAPMTDGMIVFQSPSNAEQSAQGEVDSDGKFRLFTLINGERFDGAQQGDYRVTYFPRMSAAQTEVPIALGRSYAVVAGENVFEIKLEE